MNTEQPISGDFLSVRNVNCVTDRYEEVMTSPLSGDTELNMSDRKRVILLPPIYKVGPHRLKVGVQFIYHLLASGGRAAL